jgi:hypothetical protein
MCGFSGAVVQGILEACGRPTVLPFGSVEVKSDMQIGTIYKVSSTLPC